MYEAISNLSGKIAVTLHSYNNLLLYTSSKIVWNVAVINIKCRDDDDSRLSSRNNNHNNATHTRRQ